MGKLRRFSTLLPLALLAVRALSQGGWEGDSILHTEKIERITYSSGRFEIVGNLYLPLKSTGRVPVERVPAVMWVSGSGPSYREVRNADTKRQINCFLDNGVAYFRIDKPGSGDSRGSVDEERLFAQLSDVVVDGVAQLAKHPAIEPTCIGLFGSSQAGYIMPLALTKSGTIAFVIGSSCPGENSIDQWNYLLEKQLLCGGVPPERARRDVAMYMQLRTAEEKESFDEAIAYFDGHPLVIPSVGIDSSFSLWARSWWPRETDPEDESRFDPISLIEKTDVPIYLAYGAHDTQIDPLQAIAAYRGACGRSGGKLMTAILENSDHNMSLSGGCLSEIDSLRSSGGYRVDPEFLRTLATWILDVKKGCSLPPARKKT